MSGCASVAPNFVAQSTSTLRHLAIIMDGNGRWATARGLRRAAGHRAGVDAVRRTVRAAAGAGVNVLTLYAFSADNWKRPPLEVEILLLLFRRHLLVETRRLAENGVRLSIIGRRDRLPTVLRDLIAHAEHETAHGTRLHLRLAIDYSARDEILRAAHTGARTREELASSLAPGVPDVDLLIRTGAERRLSDFLLWECAYAELLFLDVMWPDFAESHLQLALSDFHSRDRRFGALTAVPA
jgi:undecaprenyl diphosphate synthase